MAGQSGTALSPSLQRLCQNADANATAALAQATARAEPVKQLLKAYLHLAGIQSSYGLFAPEVPASYRLIFALSYRDGHEESVSVDSNRAETNLRLARLTDYIGQSTSPLIRESMIKLLAYSAWRSHRGATGIRAFVLTIAQPTPEEFRLGQRLRYEKLFTYDFSPTDADSISTP